MAATLSRPFRCLIQLVFYEMNTRHDIGDDEATFVRFGITSRLDGNKETGLLTFLSTAYFFRAKRFDRL
jgi:hypothetical protein